MSVKSKFTAIADEIRTLTDNTYSMDLDDILSTLNEAKTEVVNQTDLILQITEEFDYKTMDLEEKFISARNFKTYENNESENIGNGAFAYCFNLTSASFPNCTTIGYGAFAHCSRLTSVNFPSCTTIGNEAFGHCDSLISINFPKCADIGEWTFSYCANLSSVNFPNCITIGYNAFIGCRNLVSVSFPNCISIHYRGFPMCNKLTSISLPNCIHIGSQTFKDCYNLSQVYLTGLSLCKLNNSDAFDSTPFTGYSSYFSGTPYIYVPESLVTSYQTATNWTYFSSMIVPY